MNDLKSGYQFLVAFVYPATLGAALAWWIQALATALDGTKTEPTTWALFFGLWFIAYHAIWYWFLVTAPKDTDGIPKGYSLRSLWTDVLDTTAMMLGFGGLGLASGNYDKTHAGVAFFAVLVLMFSAAIANYPRWSAGQRSAFTYPIPFALAFIIPIIGLSLYARSGTAGESACWLLLLLYGVLVAYFWRPDLFSSHRDPKLDSPNPQ